MQGELSIERMCQLAGVSRVGFYRSLQEQELSNGKKSTPTNTAT